MSHNLLYLLLLVFLSQQCFSDDDLTIEEEEYYDGDDELMEEPEVEEEAQIEEPDYNLPSEVLGAYLFETFQGEDPFQNGWTHSGSSDFPGKFQVGQGGDNPHLSVEKGLYVPSEAQRYAVFGSLDKVFSFEKDSTFVVQYEVRLHNELQCGGAYIKLASEQGSDWKPKDVTNNTPYTVMFGPDKCGGTNKVHFIWRFQNPVTKEYEEHHLKNSPTPAGTSDKKSHLYTLVIRSDNTFEVFIDKKSTSTGNLLTDFEPPLVPSKQIDDPEDHKPEDWVDDAKIPDPDASKPDDWDEDAPRRIEDPDAVKPDGWNEDAPFEIEDPDAQEPEDWDEEDDGEWEAPLIDNPACAIGCGEWKSPMIDNPDYKGMWNAPMVDNPAYNGEWGPKQIDNPAYFDEQNPYQKLDSVAGVVVDIWTMQKGIEYDNVYVGNSEDAAYELAKSWEVRHEFQGASMKSSTPSGSTEDDDTIGKMIDLLKENIVAVGVTAALLVFSFIYFFCCGSDDPTQVTPASETDEAEKEEEEEEQEKKEESTKVEKEDKK